MRDIRNDQLAGYINSYGRLVFSVCLSFTGNYFDAEDLAQETFLAAFKHFDSFDGKNPKAWLTAIAANKCRDYLKSPSQCIEKLTEEDWADIEDDGATPEEKALDNETKGRVLKLCQRLKEPYRQVALSYFISGVKISELSRKTGVGLKTLQTQLYRSKILLRKLWKEEFS